MSAVIDLDMWDRLLIVLAAGLFLLLVLVCLICVLHPVCWLHRHCPCRYSDDEKIGLQSGYGSMHDPAFVGVKKTYGLKGQQGGQWHPMLPLRESEPSDFSDISMPEIIEMKQDSSSGRRRKTSHTSDYSSGASSIVSHVQQDSRLAYGLAFDRALSKFHIRVIQLGNFRVTEPDGATAPYVKVRVYREPKHFFSFKLRSAKDVSLCQLETEVQTKIQRRTDNPLFNETFSISVEEQELAACIIKFIVCDFDKFSRHVGVGEVTCDVSKVDLLSGNEVLFNDLLIDPQPENLGELHLALMYLPTAEKLSMMVLNARGLRPLEGPRRNTETFVKITLMYDGRPLKKTKTLAKGNDLNPTYNETFVFDVPAYQLDKVYFSIAVIGVEKDKEDGRHLLGRLYIGVSFDPDARAQWLEMVHNARKQVACWHKLRG